MEVNAWEGKVRYWRFLLDDISMLVAEAKERSVIWEREVFRMLIRGPNEKRPEVSGAGKVSFCKAGRVVRAGTERE